MLIKALAVGLVVGVVVLLLIAVFDVVVRVMSSENRVVGEALNETIKGMSNESISLSTKYSAAVDSMVKGYAWVFAFVVVGAVLVYALHTRRR